MSLFFFTDTLLTLTLWFHVQYLNHNSKTSNHFTRFPSSKIQQAKPIPMNLRSPFLWLLPLNIVNFIQYICIELEFLKYITLSKHEIKMKFKRTNQLYTHLENYLNIMNFYRQF